MKLLNELFPIRAEIASNVLNDGREWISVFNWSDTSMPTPPPVHWSAQGSWKNEQPGGEISAIDDCVLSCFNPVSVTATMSRFFDERDCFRFDGFRIDCCHLIMSFEPEGPAFKLTSPASRPRCCNWKIHLKILLWPNLKTWCLLLMTVDNLLQIWLGHKRTMRHPCV